ncbi:MAG: MFS transporter, partial [Gaiellaceae bacterium]
VSSYDALGSFVLVPLGMAFVGPIAAVTGTAVALWLAVAVFVGATAVIAAIPSVRAIRASTGEAGAAPTMAPR